ncbi:hypothetical protein Hanom_Chr05g00412831 [Helianthus anomalus]
MLRLRKAPATFLLTAQLRAGTQLVALARHSDPNRLFTKSKPQLITTNNQLLQQHLNSTKQ